MDHTEYVNKHGRTYHVALFIYFNDLLLGLATTAASTKCQNIFYNLFNPVFGSAPGNIYQLTSRVENICEACGCLGGYMWCTVVEGVPPWSIGSVLDHRSLPPMFKSRHGQIWRLFHPWLRFITFGGRSAYLAYHMHKSGRKT